MKSQKVSCLLWAIVFLAAAGASGWFVHRRAPSGAFVGSMFGGVIIVIALGWLLAVPTRIGEWLLIVRARLGREPRDGKRIAVIGTLRGSGELHAPFSRERCVLYSYEIFVADRKAYAGFAMVPLSVEDGADRIRLLTKPEITTLTATQLESTAGAQHFIENTTFTPAGTADDQTRYDYSYEPLETNLGGARLVEKFLRGDTNVCALGTYRADRHALDAPVTLRTGTSFAIDAAWRVVNAGLGAALCIAIAAVALAVFSAKFPNDMAEDWWEINFERRVDKHVRMPLVHAGIISTPGFQLQPVCVGCAKGRLELDGRTIELKHAAYTGGRSVHLSANPGDRDGVTLDGSERVVSRSTASPPTCPDRGCSRTTSRPRSDRTANTRAASPSSLRTAGSVAASRSIRASTPMHGSRRMRPCQSRPSSSSISAPNTRS
ncbi:MAG: hypothetical protein ACJ74H_15255 [Thermoanaerobaculia bacterium]